MNKFSSTFSSRKTIEKDEKKIASQKTSGYRRKYIKPRLCILSDLRTLTLGASPGNFESGFPPTKDPILG